MSNGRERQSRHRSLQTNKTKLAKLEAQLAAIEEQGYSKTGTFGQNRHKAGSDTYNRRVANLRRQIEQVRGKLPKPKPKEELAIPNTEEAKFKQKYPNLDYYDNLNTMED